MERAPDWGRLPDVTTLPDEDLLPILVRCRHLDAEALQGTLDDVLRQTFRKAELSDAETKALLEVLRARLANGSALLLIDGLDEIQDLQSRLRFAQHLEQVNRAYPDILVVVTSRIVGYREMRYRIGRGFDHVTIADL